MILLIPKNKNNSDVRKDLHCTDGSDANFEIANELIDSNEEKKCQERFPMQTANLNCNANFSYFPLAPPSLIPEKNHFLIFLIKFHLIFF